MIKFLANLNESYAINRSQIIMKKVFETSLRYTIFLIMIIVRETSPLCLILLHFKFQSLIRFLLLFMLFSQSIILIKPTCLYVHTVDTMAIRWILVTRYTTIRLVSSTRTSNNLRNQLHCLNTLILPSLWLLNLLFRVQRLIFLHFPLIFSNTIFKESLNTFILSFPLRLLR